MRYQDLGPDYYEWQAATRCKIAYQVREIEAPASTSPSPALHRTRTGRTSRHSGRLTRPKYTRPPKPTVQQPPIAAPPS
jgi:hypothetical protein